MEAKTNPTPLDLMNLEHWFMALKDALTHDYRWGSIRVLLEMLLFLASIKGPTFGNHKGYHPCR
jgi:hypothetical protein